MRISTSQIFQQNVDVMLSQQLDLSNTQLQLSTGKKILKPSDDPTGAVRVLDLREAEQRIATYQRNANWATGRLQQEEVVLSDMTDILQRIRELTVQGNNDVLADYQRGAIALEIEELRNGFLDLANTRDANGEYIFAGYSTDTKPLARDDPPAYVDLYGVPVTGDDPVFNVTGWSFEGDSGQRYLKIGDGREVAIGDPGSVFFGIEMRRGDDPNAAPVGTTNIGAILDRVAENFSRDQRDDYALQDLDAALERITLTRARVGARMNSIDDQRVANESFDLALKEVRSSVEDLDYAEAVARFNQQMTALQASQQAFVKVQEMSLFNYIR
jgi:flagellar hook-associated protein 3 FlgL